MNKNLYLLLMFGVVILLLLPNVSEAKRCDCDDMEWYVGAPKECRVYTGVQIGGTSCCTIGNNLTSGDSAQWHAVDKCAYDTDHIKCKNNACPDWGDWNGETCSINILQTLSCAIAVNENKYGPGAWDASQTQCVLCSGNLETHKFGDIAGLYVGFDGNFQAGADIPDTCESACGADSGCDEETPNTHKYIGIYPVCSLAGQSYFQDYCDGSCNLKDDTTVCEASFTDCTADPACDNKAPNSPCGTNGTCNDSCQCIEVVCPAAVCGGYNGYYSDFPNWRFYDLNGGYPFDGCAYANAESCDDDDSCYAYGTGCEERDYSCSNGSCAYSYSNRHTDECVSYGTGGCAERDWYCSGSSCTYTDSNQNDDRCVDDDWYDYYCSGSSCIYTISYDYPDCVICTPHHHVGCWNNDVYWYDSCNNLEEKYQECGDDYYQCCNGSCGYQLVDQGCSAGSCYSLPGSCIDCGYYTCSAGSCTTNCSQACGAPCDEGSDCPSGTCQANCTCLVVTECTAGGSCSTLGEVCCTGGVLYECQGVTAFGPSGEVYAYEESPNEEYKNASLGTASIVDIVKEFWQKILRFSF